MTEKPFGGLAFPHGVGHSDSSLDGQFDSLLFHGCISIFAYWYKWDQRVHESVALLHFSGT